jgi:hypothetical protein
MARNLEKSGAALIQKKLAVMVGLTQDLAAAVAQGNLDLAVELLEKRRRALQGFVWPEEIDPDIREKIQALRGLEDEVAAFCRSWREVVGKRLRALHNGHFLRLSYGQTAAPSRFIDVSK